MNRTIPTVSALFSGAATIEEMIGKIATYKLGDDLGPMNNIESAVRGSAGNNEARIAIAAALAGVLSSDATREAKVFASRQLAVCGGPEIAAAIAPLLTSIDSSNFTRYAVEQIPGAEIDGVLLDALGKADLQSQIGIVSSLGARKSAAAVPAISKLLTSNDAALANAAAAALGHIGGADAVKALSGRVAKTARDTAANALLEAGESAKAAGDAALAERALKEASSGGSKAVRAAAKRALAG